ncbi:hypothetical protein LQ567_06165 [Niabella pedocola]|uniref:Lipocalin-like domain-containing protein n=1 Tax=Niabella pedocola TaxID=1752077 RepID=A0ABS8PML4_9BACT|nr:hypothetical protein [Niabella pedocola]MCD2422340.1 hypothetical protein [Niabella pedocola]
MKFRLIPLLLFTLSLGGLFACQKNREVERKAPPASEAIQGTWLFSAYKGPLRSLEIAPYTLHFSSSGIFELRSPDGVLTEKKRYQLLRMQEGIQLDFPDQQSVLSEEPLWGMNGATHIVLLNQDSLVLGGPPCCHPEELIYFIKQP